MNIGLCHLCDIHIDSTKDNIILERVKKIAAAINCNLNGITHLFILVTGDIAQSSSKEDYAISLDFFLELETLITDNREVVVQFLFVPGNHDLDFTAHLDHDKLDSIRDNLIRKLEFDPSLLKYQNNFFDFCSLFNPNNNNKLIHHFDTTIDRYKMRFNIINTSWISRKQEKYGDIFIPESQFISCNIESFDIVITLFHHPIEWFSLCNRINFEKYITENSNLIFVGHEHTGRNRIILDSNSSYELHAGEVLQDRGNKQNSGFCFYILNTDENKISKQLIYTWTNDKDMYVKREVNLNNLSISNNSYYTPEFQDKLNTPDVEIQHRYKDNIKLDDLFIYPNLKIVKELVPEDNKKADENIDGDKIIQYVLDNKHIYISGEFYSGKTALGKMICKNLIQKEIYPLLLNGSNITRDKINKLDKLIEDCQCSQLLPDMIERYEQFATSKALIIDDFDKSYGNENSLNSYINYFITRFQYVIILSNSLVELEILKDSVDDTRFSFKKLNIKHFNKRNIYKLVEKWYLLGREDSISQDDLKKDINNAQDTINMLVKDSNLPTVPLNIVLVLQQLNISISQRNEMSNCGYLFDYIISRGMMQLSDTINKSVISGFLSHLAYFMFMREKKMFEYSEMTEVAQDFDKRFGQRINLDAFIYELIVVKLLKSERDLVSFSYPYVYYYYIAKYLAEKISKPDVIEIIKNMTKKLYLEDYGKIMVFLCHLSKDERIIQELLNNSTLIFKDIKPLVFENKESLFFNISEGLHEHVELLFVPEENQDARDMEKLEHYDEEIAVADNFSFDSDNDDLEECEEQLNKLRDVNNAFKSIEVMGQILKNYPGSIDAEIQHCLIHNIHDLGMKTLTFTDEIVKINLDILVTKVGNKLLEENMFISKFELFTKIKKEVSGILLTINYGIIRKLSFNMANDGLLYSIESSDLNSLLSYRLIRESIDLNNFGKLKNSVVTLHEELIENKNYDADIILKLMVLDHFYTFGSDDVRKRQSLCKKLNIKQKNLFLAPRNN